MKKDKDTVLKLSVAEKKLLSVLSAIESKSPADLTREALLPRTTVMRTLKSLQGRGFAISSKNKNRTVWQLITSEVLGISMSGKSSKEFIPLRGVSVLTQTLYSLLESLPRNGRFTGVQPTASAAESIRKMGVEGVIKINELIKNKHIIVQGVLEEDFLPRLYALYGASWLKSFRGRLAHTVVIPKQYLKYRADVYVIGEQAMLVNWHDETGVLIKNRDVVGLLKSMFSFLHDFGNRIDNDEIAKLLSKD